MIERTRIAVCTQVPAEHVAPEELEGAANDREHAALGDEARQHRARGGRGHGVGLGQPHLQRHHTGLRAEAQDNQKRGNEQGLLIADELSAVEGEAQIIALGGEHEEAQQRKRRAEGGVAEVGKACAP